MASSVKLSGQRCVSAGRLIVHRSVLDNFAKRFCAEVANLKTGDPFKTVVKSTGTPECVAWDTLEPNTEMYYGPIINNQGMNKILKYNQMVLDDSEATVLTEGRKVGSKGNFLSPMIYISEWRNVPYLKNEVFGPHVAIIPFDTVEDAIRIYNDTDYGLALGVVTENFKTARLCRDECDAGMIYWNGGSIAAESHLSFGGVKKSGNGFPSAARTFRAVTHEVSWTVNHGESLAFPQGMQK